MTFDLCKPRIMLEKIKQTLNNYTFLGPKDIFKLISILNFKTIYKGEYIVRIGEMNYSSVLVLKGLLRSYIINEEGAERTMLFVPENKNAASYQTVLRNKPSVENIMAIEDSWIAIADFRKFEKLTQTNPALMLYHNKIMKDVLASTVDQVWFHLVLTPEQRYLKFREQFPKLDQRVSQKDLASYLGISATSLSRLRARISKS